MYHFTQPLPNVSIHSRTSLRSRLDSCITFLLNNVFQCAVQSDLINSTLADYSIVLARLTHLLINIMSMLHLQFHCTH